MKTPCFRDERTRSGVQYEHENCDSKLSLPYLAVGRIEGWSPINERSKASRFPLVAQVRFPGLELLGAGRRISLL